MKKEVIIVPEKIRYISEWGEMEGGYSLENFPFPHILDKKIPGCGFTEYCLTNEMNVVLCSPRRILLENKKAQHGNDIFYFKNDAEQEVRVDADLIRSDKMSQEDNSASSKLQEIIRDRFLELKNYFYQRLSEQKPMKIVVTYDSFKYVKEFLMLEGCLEAFQVVVDEFQSVFVDSVFKSSTELEFLHHIQGINKLCYVSATPMIENYLDQLIEFQNLPYFELDWATGDPLRVANPTLKISSTKSIISSANQIIKAHLEGYRETLPGINESGKLVNVSADELVFFVNSINNIITIINRHKLSPDQCNILCANTTENANRIRAKLGSKYTIGSVPLKGEPHKMFTFCTRTVYLGADFYSTNARSIVLSDANIEAMTVDITLDLPQILGRQRLSINPWKNQAELYYRPLTNDNISSKFEFDKHLADKLTTTNSMLIAYNSTPPANRQHLAKVYEKCIAAYKYKDDYIAIERGSNGELVPVLNRLVMVAEQRAFDIQQVDYKDRFTVFNTVRDANINASKDTLKIMEYLGEFDRLAVFNKRLKFLCELDVTEEVRMVILHQVPSRFRRYYLGLGPKRCKALGYVGSRLEKEYSDKYFDEDLLAEKVYANFDEGKKYTGEYIKQELTRIYKEVGYNKAPTSQAITRFFEVEDKILSVNGKRARGYLIVARKS